MSETIELLVSVPGQGEPIVVLVPREAHVAEVVEIIRGRSESGIAQVGEVFLFLDGGQEALGQAVRLDDHGVSHGHRVHAHRCRQVEVSVEFAEVEQTHPFPPNSTVGQVRHWAMEAFNPPTATEAYVLEASERSGHLADQTRLHALTHHCHLRLELISHSLIIRYKVNAEDQVSNERYRTARLILEKAEFNPADYYLKHGDTSYEGKPDEPIRLHEGEKFTALYTGGGTVSQEGA